MHNDTIRSLSAELAARKLSSVELTQHFLKRIKTLKDRYNCFITLDEEASLKQARAADGGANGIENDDFGHGKISSCLSVVRSVAQRFVVHEHVADAVERLLLAAQR